MGLTAVILAATVCAAADDGQLTVLPPQPENNAAAADMLYAALAREADEAWSRRRDRYEQLKTQEQCVAYQQQLREFFVRQLGGFPERTPLAAQVVGQLEGDDYRVEKIIYASRPNHHVTAALYLPRANPPYPAVLIACGHSKNGKAAGYNQRMGILLAKHGMAAMCYDPIGQGERSQVLNPDGSPKYSSTAEHTQLGVGAMLVGVNTAQYRIYDGIRGIDYLASRPDIDAARIGCTGCSGGGTLTSYLMALDDRIACAAPACYLTTFGQLINSIGPQDAEQNIFGQIAFGMDQTDYVLMRAPRPTIICATTRDFFDINGSWDTFRQAKRFYARFGAPERVDLVEDDDGHGVTKLNRETLTHWMQRWLLGKDREVEEPEFPEWTDEQLQCTPDGQVLLLPGERSAFELNAELLQVRKLERAAKWATMAPDEIRRAVRATAGIRSLDQLPPTRVRKIDTLLREGQRIEKLVIQPEQGIELPALVFVPREPTGQAYLYLHEQGKQADAAAGGPIEQLVKQGHIVMAVDLRGLGETMGGRGQRLSGESRSGFLAYLLGKSLVGLRAEDVWACARFSDQYSLDDRRRELRVIAVGRVGVPALHAAAVEPDLFDQVLIRRMVTSYENIVLAPDAKNQLSSVVHGALAFYDLPDLARLAGPGKVLVEESLDSLEQPLEQGP